MQKNQPAKTKGKVGPLDLEIAANLRRLRLDSELSQEDLAESAHITFQQIQKYEAATNRISASRLCELADILDVSPLALLPGKYQDKKSQSVHAGVSRVNSLKGALKKIKADAAAALRGKEE